MRDGVLTTRSGMSYRVLALDPSTRRMSLPLLRRIAELAAAGAAIVGAAPEEIANLSGDRAAFQRLARETWRGPNVIANPDLAAALASLSVAADFTYSKPQADTKLFFVHRRLEEGDLYFVNSRNDRAQQVEASFRVSGKAPELWRADTGALAPLSYRIANGRTLVPLALEPLDAVFVVFREQATSPSRTVPAHAESVITELGGAWTASFPLPGGRREVRFATLTSWTEDPAIQYFSGTATYVRNLDLPAPQSGERILLDLGAVNNLAEVIVNGRNLGVAWKRPFRVEITDAARPGRNSLEIRVVNLWPNRLIGDKKPGAGEPQRRGA